MTHQAITFMLFLSCLAVSTGTAFIIGGVHERLVAAALLAASAGSIALARLFPASFEGVRWGIFMLDAGLLGVLAAMAVRHQREWVSWCAAVQLVVVVIHALRLLDPGMMPAVYGVVQMDLAYPILGCLIWGAIQSRQQRLTATNEASSPGYSGQRLQTGLLRRRQIDC